MISDSDRSERGTCWFCERLVPWEGLIAGYDTWEEQRLACPDCDSAIKWLMRHGFWISRGDPRAAYKVELAEKVRALRPIYWAAGHDTVERAAVLRLIEDPAPPEGGEGRP